MSIMATMPGSPFPLGATAGDSGTNFAVASSTADGILLCLFDSSAAETRVPLQELDAGVWHTFVPGAGPGQAYGYRATGPYEPARGARCHPAKLLTDPYALAITGRVRYGPEVLGYAVDDPDQPSELDSAAYVPRSLVV
jgi:glycogen operon protein